MCVYEAQPAKMPGAESVFRKVGNKHASPVSNEDIVYCTAAVYQESQLSSDLMGKGSQLLCGVGGQDLPGPRFPPREPLKSFDLAGFQACRLSLNRGDILSSGFPVRMENPILVLNIGHNPVHVAAADVEKLNTGAGRTCFARFPGPADN